MSQVFPPAAPTVLDKIIPAYAYVQYNDDDNIVAFFNAYNGAAQYYLDWFANVNLPIYTGLSGTLLDWIAQGLYGMTRPTLESVGALAKGPFNTTPFNTIPFNAFVPGTPDTFFQASDDLFKRVMTWQLYRGDGRYFTMKWLKRRVYRFLYGANGAAPSAADTSQISITIAGDIVTINLTAVTGVSPTILSAFLYVILGGIVELPAQYLFEVII